MDRHTYTVSELTDRVAASLQRTFADEVWVQGEIRDLSRSRNGHVYFSLVDPGTDGRESVLPVTLFASERHAVNRVLQGSGAVRMTDGINVRIRGRLGLYAQRSIVQLRMSWIDTDFTLGQLAAERAALIKALTGDGSLARNGLLAMPVVPLVVGLVTSSGSAAHADFLTELERSGLGFRVVVSHATVQGVAAAGSIAQALDRLAAHPLDVVALVRGGGAQTDLATFDTEVVARAISRCVFPVLTGIGHETDQTVADLAAHGALKTPTATAQAIVGTVRSFVERLDRLADAVDRTHRVVMDRSAGRIDHLSFRLGNMTDRHLERRRLRLDTLSDAMARRAMRSVASAEGRLGRVADLAARSARRRLSEAGADLDRRSEAAGSLVHRSLADALRRVDLTEAVVHSRDPAAMFARGWSITYGPEGSPVRDPAEVAVSDRLRTVVEGGTLTSVVVDAGEDS